MSNITWEYHKGKYVIQKDGVFLSLTPDQVTEMRGVLEVIEQVKLNKIKEGEQ